jgi:hypothetical protein
MNNKPCINLVGSYHGFRDEIINALPGYPIKDPRMNRQTATAKIVIDDLTNAEQSDICFVVAPRGKSRGVMTYVEIGDSYAHGKYIINVDENDLPDSFLISFSDKSFTSLKDGLDFILNNNFESENKREIPPDVGYANSLKKASQARPLNIFLHGSLQNGLKEIMHQKLESKIEKKFFIPSQDGFTDFELFRVIDYLAVHFPKGYEINRQACFFMGVAWAYSIPIVLIEENAVPYPPLQAVARRQFRGLKPALDYLSLLETPEVEKESTLMYQLFQKYNLKQAKK